MDETGFLDLLPPHSSLIAYKGFNISAECAAHSINLVVPPGRRGTLQMTPGEVKKNTVKLPRYR